eukprot:jgi/Picsp_1/3431/NSC_06269-R1_hypothetical protein CHLNCDRAFT_143475 [Chlorella variabilis]
MRIKLVMYENDGISTSCGKIENGIKVKHDGDDAGVIRVEREHASVNESGPVCFQWKQEEELPLSNDDRKATERNNNAAEAHEGIIGTADEKNDNVCDPLRAHAFSADAHGRLHHLTRHWLAPDERGGRAIEILGASDMKTAEALIRNMPQRDLRLAFEQVYESKTKSFNNIWLRRKLFEAIGSNSASSKKKKTKRVIAAAPLRRTKQTQKSPPTKERACLQGLLDHRRFDPPILSLNDNAVSRSPFPPAPPAPPLFKQQYDKKVSRASNIDTAALEALAKLASEYVPMSPTHDHHHHD